MSLVALLCATATAGYMVRVNVSTAGALIMDEYSLSQVDMGRIFSAFLLGYALFQIPSGSLADYLGGRKVLTLASWLWVALTLAPILASRSPIPSLMVSSLTGFLVFRFMLGIAASPAYPASAKCVSVWIPPAFQGRANGIILASVGIGSALTPPLVSYIMVEFGWRLAMVTSAIPALVIALIWQRVKEPAHALIVQPIQHSGSSATGSVKSWSFAFLTLSYTLQGYVGYIFVSWFYLYLVQERRFSLLSSGWISSLPWMLTVIAIPLGGILTDRLVLGRLGPIWGVRLIPIVAMSLSGVLIAIGAHTESAWVAAITLAFATAFVLSVEGPFWTMMMRIGGSKSGMAGGIMNAGSNAGGLVSPILTPLLATYIGWENALLIAAGLAIVGGVLWLGIVPPEGRIENA